MLKRTLYFTTPIRLSLKDNQLICRLKEASNEIKCIPIEDLSYIIIEDQQVHITIPLLNALINQNVAVVICNDLKMPNAYIQPLDANSIQGETYRFQKDASEPLKKKLWKQCVEAKIKNQSLLLNKLGLDGDLLKPLYCNVKSGDNDNREGAAAKLYWKLLFDNNFSRNRDGHEPNNLLNYGYTILRAAVSRSLIGSGLLPAFGIFHRNRYNAFPLADDIMEPYRPFVDEIVYQLYHKGKIALDKDVKANKLRVLYSDCQFKKICRPLDIALTITSASLVKCLSGKEKKILFPSIK